MPYTASDVLAVTDALARLAATGDGYAIVESQPGSAFYVQFVAYGPELYGEMPGNGVSFAEDEPVSYLQQGELRARGWHGDGVVNWSRTWPDYATDAARAAIAHDALGALRDVYGAHGIVHDDVVVQVTMGGASRPSGGVAVLVAFGLASAAFFALWLLYFHSL